jgi:hypothetical protein
VYWFFVFFISFFWVCLFIYLIFIIIFKICRLKSTNMTQRKIYRRVSVDSLVWKQFSILWWFWQYILILKCIFVNQRIIVQLITMNSHVKIYLFWPMYNCMCIYFWRSALMQQITVWKFHIISNKLGMMRKKVSNTIEWNRIHCHLHTKTF